MDKKIINPEQHKLNNQTTIPFAFPGLPHVHCAFSTVFAGNIAVNVAKNELDKLKTIENRKALCHICSIPGWSELTQVHGNISIEAEKSSIEGHSSFPEADGQHTNRPGIALAIKTADCQPLLFTNIQGTAIAALHVGWRGNRINFPATGLKQFCEKYDFTPEEVMAVRGPSLGPGEAEFINFDTEWGENFLPWFNKKRKTMDLWTLTKHQLMEAGIREHNIFSLDLCTKSLPEMFFSFRRGDTGRQVSLIWMD